MKTEDWILKEIIRLNELKSKISDSFLKISIEDRINTLKEVLSD